MQIDSTQIQKYLSGVAEDYILELISKPQLCMGFIYKAKNKIQQLLTQQLLILDDLLISLKYVKNTEKQITNTLTSAKTTATQMGYGQTAVDKYKSKLAKFLSQANIKSGNSDEFAKTDVDAKEDIFGAIKTFMEIQEQLEILISNFKNTEEDLKKIDVRKLLKIAANKVSTELPLLDESKNDVSKISLAIDLYSSASVLEYLESLSSFYEEVFSPILSSSKPKDMSFKGKSEEVTAQSYSLPYPRVVTSGEFKFTTDTIHSIDFPSTAAKNRAYILSESVNPTFDIPPNTRLYLKITAPIPPAGSPLLPETFVTDVGVIPITIPSGIQSFASVASAITAGMLVNNVMIVPTQFGYADHFSINGSNRLMIYGDSAVTKIEVISAPIGYVPILTFIPAKPSNHESLGLAIGASQPIDTPSYKDVKDCISYTYPITQETDRLLLTAQTGVNPPLTFQTGLATELGFTNFLPPGNRFTLTPLVNPRDYGVYDGCIFINQIFVDGNTIIGTCPIGEFELEINSDLINLKTLLSISYTSPKDFLKIWGAIFDNPTSSQIIAAENYTKNLIQYLTQLNISLTFIAKESPLLKDVNNYLRVLENKGLDKQVDLLVSCQFSNFFNSTENNKTYGIDLMNSIEEGIKNVP